MRVDLPAQCTLHDVPFPARILMLGGGGLLLETDRQLSPNSELKICFRPASHLSVIEVIARVRYQLPHEGTGVEFAEIKPEDREIILQVIFRRISHKPRHARKKFVTQIEHETGDFLGSSRDLSVGGMFIETKTPLPEGSSIVLRFHLDDGGPIVLVEAVVRYAIRDLCMGIEFVNLSPTDRNRIEAYVANAK